MKPVFVLKVNIMVSTATTKREGTENRVSPAQIGEEVHV
jgi:hypothetical protein